MTRGPKATRGARRRSIRKPRHAEVGVGAKPKFVVRQKDMPGNTNAVTAGIVEE